MILYPAIDIRDGRAVRLAQGDYERETVYDADPLDAALRWVAQGAEWLHVVDLDGAREGRPTNLEHVRRIASTAGVPVQAGGGIRDEAALDAVLDSGAARAILGTRAQRDPGFVREAVAAHGTERIVVGIDTRGGMVAVEGWSEATGTGARELVEAMVAVGVTRVVYTPVERDGLMEGPAVGELQGLGRAGGVEVIYSGGIGSLDDLSAIAASGIEGIGGVIVGRALYEARFTVADARRALLSS